MKALQCIHHDGCRYQQKLYQVEEKYETPSNPSWPVLVRCDDRRTDMEKHCRLFKRTGADRP